MKSNIHAWSFDFDFHSKSLKNLQHLPNLAGWFSFLQVNNEAQTRPARHGQILLRDLQLPAPFPNGISKLFWIESIHNLPIGNINLGCHLVK